MNVDTHPLQVLLAPFAGGLNPPGPYFRTPRDGPRALAQAPARAYGFPVSTYIALLRAVNVGGTGRLPMADLRTLCAKA